MERVIGMMGEGGVRGYALRCYRRMLTRRIDWQ